MGLRLQLVCICTRNDNDDWNRKPHRAPPCFWGIPLSLAVLGLKLLAWWLTGSVALLSDGLESTVNVIAAVIAYLMIGYASKPADAGHPSVTTRQSISRPLSKAC